MCKCNHIRVHSEELEGQSAPKDSVSDVPCQRISTVDSFDITKYTSKPWYIHQQAVTAYLSEENNYCVRAQYTILDSPTLPFLYTIDVYNYSEDIDGNAMGGSLCASVGRGQPKDSSKLAVAPCFLPQVLDGPYWIVLYNEKDGYALVSGGQPFIPTRNGLCRTSERTTGNAGLWIFLRSSKRDNKKIDKVRKKAQDMGFDLSVLNDVKQGGFCKYPPFPLPQ
eukprot:CAMPEP_0194361884 /NCGR_PEP_ID=MMETSP0174-20130528/9524_1 /TAXON_ID=216777 /ORGANISM="Proboscia alata, Strain PI-D3" /LENGTH=222 /DNA_ID=CAMNT_0039134361 /DNA_START=139 /DNA_END=807 /DNA_ORIENTATION=+